MSDFVDDFSSFHALFDVVNDRYHEKHLTAFL